MFDEVMGAYGSRFLLAAGGVGIALVLLIGILWILRSRAPSPFVRGGKNRQPRLQVLDAAAVDTRRRLVLVRRDDVEHLIMIGGPTDIVIESRILQEKDEGSDHAFIPTTLPPAPRPEPVVSTPVEPARPVTAFEREPEPDEPYAPAPAPAPVVEPRLHPVATAPAAAPAEQAPAAPSAATSAVATKIEREPASPAALSPIIPRPAERAAAPVIEAASAADILDAARQRVLPQQRMEPQVSTPPAQSLPTVAEGIPVVTGDAAAPSKAAPSDFERILQEEMNNTLAAQRIVPAASAPARPVPPQPGNPQRRDPEMAPITGADADLQKEVARIFGEMSVNREK
ncbi:Flagellar biosynthesis protein, FliO [Rhizobium mongolense subsp. loessense]|uniref:Flagellar biosynthesis protein, FliO n=1 Tax=Rhizobium mongolense subsp. loessense TaxID=158890 RepID=A0A1G4RMD5_9HYPH|nr:flagellar biosynthetic protein FliO [Rhizobium mongolense]SCW57958.1 Flagellar biosynthesis protein, FliO [Rhizobium mongolense subsp. loessense]